MTNFVIKNGRVIDPAAGTDRIEDLYVKNGVMCAAQDFAGIKPDEEIDASGCIVVPGLVDSHAHVAKWNSMIGIQHEACYLPSGVTSCIDMGTCGSASFEGFARYTVPQSPLTIRGYMNVSSGGEVSIVIHPNMDPQFYDLGAIEYAVHYFPRELIGFKVFISNAWSGGLGLSPLEKTVELGEKYHLPVAVHVTDPPMLFDDIVNILRPGDILCHCFQPTGNTILDEAGHVRPAVRAAQERGVLFDAAYGRMNYAYHIIERAFADGFYPDLVGSDMIIPAAYSAKLFSMPYVMSSLYNKGMALHDLVRAATYTGAKVLHMEDNLGTLAPGTDADIAVFKLQERDGGYLFRDLYGNSFQGRTLFVPQLTVKSGRVLYRDMERTFTPA